MLDPQGVIISWNEGAERLKGYSEGEILGKHFSLFYPAEAISEGHPSHELTLAEQNGRYTEEGWRLRKDGSSFLAEVVITAIFQDGRLRGFAKVTRDITERRRAEARIEGLNEELEQRVHERTAELAESDNRFRFLAETMPQIIWTASPDGAVDYFNQRWYEYTGMTWEETKSWGWKPVLHPDDLDRCLGRWQEALETGYPYEIEYRFKRALDCAYRWHLGRAFPLRDEGGRIVRWIGTCTDIDELKLAQERIRQTNEELEKRVDERTTTLKKQAEQLRAALSEIKVLSGLLPICSYCNKIRDEKNEWERMETYVARHSEADFSHGICPECYRQHVVSQFQQWGIEPPPPET